MSPASAAEVNTFHGLSPARLMDTRSGSPTIDGIFSGTGKVTSGGTVNVTVAGRGGVPASGATSVALNVTVTDPTSAGFLTVFPAGQPRPTASNLNFTPSQTIPNMVIVGVGAGGQISIYNSSGDSHVLVDVLGWFPGSGAFAAVNPARLVDSRGGFPTIDGASAGAGPVAANSGFDFAAVGRGSVPASGTGAVALNVTVTGATAPGFLTVYPAGTPRPTASNLNFTPGQTIPNMVIVPVGALGTVAVFNGSAGTVHVIVDVLGSFPTGSPATFTGLTPARLFDGRPAQTTIDGLFNGYGSAYADYTVNVRVTGRGGVPATGVGAVALNVTVTNPIAPGYVTVYPSGTHPPTASNLNFVTGQTIPNMVIVPVSAKGQIAIFNSAGTVDVVVDVLGWFPSPSDPPVPVGNTPTLTSTGVGAATFGTPPATAIALLQPIFGAPTNDESDTFPTFDPSTGYYESAFGDRYYYPFGRHICFGAGFCLFFGGASAGAVNLTGYYYFSDRQALLFDANGLGLTSRSSDWPGAFTYTAGGCYSESVGQSATGIIVNIHSRGIFFGTITGGMFYPPESDVYVDGFYAGVTIVSADEGDC